MKDIEIMACCFSQKEDVSIAFSTSFNPADETIDSLDTDWIDIGISESFWENYAEFEPGMDKAKQALITQPQLTYREALYDVFGDFSISYQANGAETELAIDIDANALIYSLLEQ